MKTENYLEEAFKILWWFCKLIGFVGLFGVFIASQIIRYLSTAISKTSYQILSNTKLDYDDKKPKKISR